MCVIMPFKGQTLFTRRRTMVIMCVIAVLLLWTHGVLAWHTPMAVRDGKPGSVLDSDFLESMLYNIILLISSIEISICPFVIICVMHTILIWKLRRKQPLTQIGQEPS